MMGSFSRRPMYLAAAVVAIVASLGLAGAAHAAFPGQNGKLTFFSGAQDLPNIWTANPDGTGARRLTNDNVAIDPPSEPTWSADGSRIAISGLFWMSGDTTPAENDATFIVSGAFPSWSPDGQRVAYTVQPGNFSGGRALRIANLDGTGVHTLDYPGCVSDLRTAWSPDGSKIAFQRSNIAACNEPDAFRDWADIYVINTDGSGLTRLAGSGPREDSHPNWSPDGSKIAFDSDIAPPYTGGQEIFVMNADGTNPVRLTNNTVSDLAPAWSPDGTKIVYQHASESTGAPEIHIMNADGSGDIFVLPGQMPDWQPVLAGPSPAPPYDVPRSASRARVSLVPNHRQTISSSQCTARGGLNSTHGYPLALPSCNPPAFVPGTQAHIGPGSNSWAQYAVIYGDTNAANGDQANMTLRASLNDIRTAGGADYVPNPVGTDLTLVTKLRITDRFNGGSLSDPATVQDFDYQLAINCTATAGPEGSTCSLDPSADAITPDTIRENKATDMQVFRFRVNDAGTNGTRGDADDRTFAVQGIYIP
jgi:Tol biopolymer transport system component